MRRSVTTAALVALTAAPVAAQPEPIITGTRTFAGCDAFVRMSVVYTLLEVAPLPGFGPTYTAEYDGTLTLRAPWAGQGRPNAGQGRLSFAGCCPPPSNDWNDLGIYFPSAFDANGTATFRGFTGGPRRGQPAIRPDGARGPVFDGGSGPVAFQYAVALQVVPEPTTFVLAVAGATALAGLAARRRRA
jgi:hypothetical protein